MTTEDEAFAAAIGALRPYLSKLVVVERELPRAEQS